MEISPLLEKQKNLLRYWRASIKNKPLLDFKVSDSQYRDHQIAKFTLENGPVPEERTKSLFQKYKKFCIKTRKNKYPEANNKDEDEYILPIMISPFLYKRAHEQGGFQQTEKKHFFHPVWIYAYLDSEGNIFNFYPCLPPPWIAREHLSPIYKHDSTLIVGDMSDYDDFLDKNGLTPPGNSSEEDEEQNLKRSKLYWNSLYQFAVDMLEKVCPNLANLIQNSGYLETKQCLLIPADDNTTKNYSATLLKLLDSLESEDKSYSPLLSRYLNLNSSPHQPPLSMIEQFKHCASKHFGQFTDMFPLAKSQRIALHHLLMMQEQGEILAINGPPGTGKTTLIQSIIASLWTKAAIDDKQPPIIVVSSTNNRAIQNVLDNFAMVQKDDALSKRWVNGLTSFGLYLISEQKGNYQYCRQDLNGIFHGTLKDIEDNNYTHLKDYFLKNFNAYFKLNILSVAEAKSILHKKILGLYENLILGIRNSLNYRMILEKYPKLANKEKINLKLAFFKNKFDFAAQEIEKLNMLEINWKKIKNNTSWKLISVLNGLLPNFLKQFKINKIELFILENRLSIKSDEITVDNHVKKIKSQYASKKRRLKHLIDIHEKHLKEIDFHKKKWEEWKKKQKADHLNIENIYDFEAGLASNEENISEFLDTKIRYLLFQYSTHYWEARWLIGVSERRQKNEKNGEDKNSRIRAYQGMAMLTPCFVTTMQSGPRFFTFKMTGDQEREFMKNSIDLLIIDEAGQVNPALAAGMMALSKKACVIGDNLQLSPIPEICGAIDIGNLKHYQLISTNEEYPDIIKLGITISGNTNNNLGNAMKIAQNTCLFQEPIVEEGLNERGLFLTEHRRCVPEIIQYCNDYFYKQKMSCKRASNKTRPYPAFGYAHIPGQHKEVGKSKINEIEAWSIIKWIVKQKEVFEELYSAKLDKIIGIITPFTAQASLLKDLLRRDKINFSNNNVGTVHTFQGGEFPVIIFSPVYSHENNYTKYFFDSEETMLNVVVSRAKDHFFVFGDMDIFDAKRKIPSGFLAEHLFASEDNELKDVSIIRKMQYKDITINHINSLEEHRETLKRAFRAATERVICVSPWIKNNALQADDIETLVKQTTEKNISVIIYTDFENNFKTGNEHIPLTNCLESLENAGAEIRVIHNIHSKTLIIDNKVLIEGSFNWLSASRSYPKYEASICSTGSKIFDLIKNVVQKLEKRSPIKIKIKNKNKECLPQEY